MNTLLFTAAQKSLKEIADSMLFLPVEATDALEEMSKMVVDISALIGMSGALQGSIRLAAPDASALAIASALVGEEKTSIDAEAKDAFGEMCNMMAGGIQLRVEERMGKIRISPPLMIVGQGHRTRQDRRSSILVQELKLDGHPFFTEIQFRPPRTPPSR